MSFRTDVETAASRSVTSAAWIHAFNLVIILIAVIGIPSAAFASLFALLAVLFNSALASIATNAARQKELTKIHLMLLADRYDLR